MKRICNFNSEELACINIAQEKLLDIAHLTRHLQRLAAAEKKISGKLEALGYRRARLSPLNNNGSKPRGTNFTANLHMYELLDELIEIEDEKSETEAKLNRIINAIFTMPTERYKDILIKKYLAKEKTTQRDWNLRYCFFDAACLEFFSIYFERSTFTKKN